MRSRQGTALSGSPGGLADREGLQALDAVGRDARAGEIEVDQLGQLGQDGHRDIGDAYVLGEREVREPAQGSHMGHTGIRDRASADLQVLQLDHVAARTMRLGAEEGA